MRPQDGAVLDNGAHQFEVHAGVDEDGGYAYVTCCTCDGYVRLSNDAMQDHDCQQCAGCGDCFSKLPVIDSENGQRFCSEDCHEDASERYWTAVWSA